MKTTYADPLDALGMCLITSEAYARRHGLGLIQITGLTYPGREHWASILINDEDLNDATVRDGTARQFTTDLPAIWFTGIDDWLDTMSELLADHLHYVVYASSDRDQPFYSDVWIREDIEPGDNPSRGWKTLSARLLEG